MSGAGPSVDVVVVGAGLAGLAIAREAARAGARVVVFERAEDPVEPQSGHGHPRGKATSDTADEDSENAAEHRAALTGQHRRLQPARRGAGRGA